MISLSVSGADLVVATVGRLYDFVRAGIVEVKEVNCLVLDEADRMMDMGFEAGFRPLFGPFRPLLEPFVGVPVLLFRSFR